MAQILLVDVDPEVQAVYAAYLQKHGHVTMTAASAQQAILACETTLPDIIILDLQLVGHGGVEFLYELRSYSEWQNIPVLLHTAVPERELRGFEAAWRTLGIVGYAYKPETSLRKLLDCIEDCVVGTP